MKTLLRLLPLLAASILCAHVASAQTWVTVGVETDVVTFNQAATYSFGALSGTTTTTKVTCSATTRNCFKSFTATAGVPVVFNSNFTDPAPGVTKSVQVLQASTGLTGSTVHNGVTTQWSVPGTTPPVTLPPPVVTPPVTTPPVTTPPVTTPPAGTTPTVLSTVVLTLSCDILSNSTLNCTLPSNFTMPVVTK